MSKHPESRRWFFLGVEIHMGCRYYMWENSYSGRRWAWYAPYYALAATGQAHPNRDGFWL